MMTQSKTNRQTVKANAAYPQAPVNNSAHRTSPRTPLRGSATTFDRRGARALEHEARPPCSF